MHLPSVGLSILLVIGVQFWLATHRGHVPEPVDIVEDEPGS
jgi:hypothetical protein